MSDLDEKLTNLENDVWRACATLTTWNCEHSYKNEEGKRIVVNVSDAAYLTMLTSSIEVYPSPYMGEAPSNLQEGEVFGHLYGTVRETPYSIEYNVTAVSVAQLYTYRDYGSCAPSEYHIQKVQDITDILPGVQLLGRYHSHPYPSAEFTEAFCSHYSDTDKKSYLDLLREYPFPPLEMIFALSRLHSAKKKTYRVKDSYIVSYCKNFKCVLRAFVFSYNKMDVVGVDTMQCKLAMNKFNE